MFGIAKKLSFTKLISIIILCSYFVGVLVGAYVVIKDLSQFGTLAAYIAAPTTAIITLYCWKAKAENMVKLKHGYPEETKDTNIDLNSIGG